MSYRYLADAIVVLHAAFVMFVVFGAALVAWRRWLAWLHLPALAWGALVEINAWVCPLTPWEQRLRRAAGQAGYEGGFIDHYVLPVLYPAGLSPRIQLYLGVAVVLVNAAAYALIWRPGRRGARGTPPGSAHHITAPYPRGASDREGEHDATP